MKIQNLLRKIMPMALLLALIVIIVVSCRKKDDESNPVPPAPAPPATPDAFVPRTLHLMTDYEKTHNMRFPGYSSHLIHSGLGQHKSRGKEGESLNPLKGVGEIFSNIINYEHKKHEFAKIDTALDNISLQFTNLTTEVNSDCNAILGDISFVETLLTNENILPSLENINNLWTDFPGSWQTFMSFENAGAAYEGDSLNPVQIANMNAAKVGLKTFATPAQANGLWTDVTTIQGLIGVGNTGILSLFVETLNAKAQGSTLNSAQAMQYYMMLEGYFLNLISSQSNAEIMIFNITNYLDTTGAGTATSDYKTEFTPVIQGEVSAFLYAVDYLIANLSEYRNQTRFQSDMNYSDVGIAPDTVFIHVVARSQFLANLLYDGLGSGYPVVSGYILTPQKYNDPTDPVVNQVQLKFNNGTPVLTANASTYQSQIPYTYWEAGSPVTCKADNNWNIYRVGNLGTIDNNNWPGGTNIPVTVAVSPWVYYTPITGNVTTMFYNPENPDQTPTATYSQTNNFQFGYFSVNWHWGYLYMSDFSNSTTAWLHTDNFTCNLYTVLGWSGKVPAPQVGITNDIETYEPKGNAEFTYPANSCGLMQMTGTAISTSNLYMAFDCINCNMQTTSDPANLQGSDLQAWGMYTAMYNFQGSKGSDLWVTMGTNLYSYYGNKQMNSDGKIINSKQYQNCPNIWNGAFAMETGIKRSASYSPSFQYVYQTTKIGAVSAMIQVKTSFQMVYTGFFQLSK